MAIVGLATPAAAQDAAAKQRARQHYLKAEKARKAGDHREAIRAYEAAYAESSKAGFLFNIGLSYESLGDRPRAIEYYDRYLATKPEGDAASEALTRKAELEKQVAADRASDAAIRRGRGLDLLRAGKPADAAIELRAVHDVTSDPEVLFDLGEALHASGQREAARAAFERYGKDAPSGARAALARERIATLERELAATPAASAATADPAPAAAPSAAPTGPGAAEVTAAARPAGEAGKDRRLWWYTGAVLAVTTGVFLDQRSTSKNGELDGADFVPAGLYALGAGLVLVTVF